MTADKRWATGVRIKPADKSYDPKLLTGNNKVGLILGQIKEEIMRASTKILSQEEIPSPSNLVAGAGASSPN